MAKNLDDYIAKMQAICSARDSGSIMISTNHITKMLDIMLALKKAVGICGRDHKESDHQLQTLEMIDSMIRELDETDGKLH